jgi:glycosyltransferase involved in cell wall biosynthesis
MAAARSAGQKPRIIAATRPQVWAGYTGWHHFRAALSMAQPTLGVALIALNAAPRLAQCLEALAFADQVVLIDGGSRDATAEIARQHGARVIVETDWPGFGPQKNRALDALDTDWILSIDTDEVVSPELAQAIRAAIAAPQASIYSVDRLSSFCGRWIRHGGWYPDWIPRLFKRGTARFSDDLVHERLVFDGPVSKLEGTLLHYSYEDYETVLRKLDAYSSAGAQQRFDRGARGGGLAQALPRGIWAFLRTYLLRRGFLDGGAGFMIALFNAQTVYYRFLKLELLTRREQQKQPDTRP